MNNPKVNKARHEIETPLRKKGLQPRQRTLKKRRDGKAFRQMRKQLGWSQTEAAEHLGYKNQESISMIETGKQFVSETALILLQLHIKYQNKEETP